MLRVDRYLDVDGFWWSVLPPGVTEKPRREGLGGECCLFTDALELAIATQRDDSLNRIIDGDLLLAALRREWPEAVEAALPEIRKRDVAARVAGRKPTMPTKRKPERVPAMA